MFINKETGYDPFGGLNKFLAGVALVGIAYGCFIIPYLLTEGFACFSNYRNAKEMGITLLIGTIAAIILLVRNIRKCSNPAIGILATLLSVVLVIVIVILGLIMSWLGIDTKKNKGSQKTYTQEEDQYAKANGYFDAQSANEKGFDTSEANNPGFDYTRKK